MDIVILQTIFTVANVACVFWMYELENYKTAMFNSFAAGVCFMGLLSAV